MICIRIRLLCTIVPLFCMIPHDFGSHALVLLSQLFSISSSIAFNSNSCCSCSICLLSCPFLLLSSHILHPPPRWSWISFQSSDRHRKSFLHQKSFPSMLTPISNIVAFVLPQVSVSFWRHDLFCLLRSLVYLSLVLIDLISLESFFCILDTRYWDSWVTYCYRQTNRRTQLLTLSPAQQTGHRIMMDPCAAVPTVYDQLQSL